MIKAEYDGPIRLESIKYTIDGIIEMTSTEQFNIEGFELCANSILHRLYPGIFNPWYRLKLIFLYHSDDYDYDEYRVVLLKSEKHFCNLLNIDIIENGLASQTLLREVIRMAINEIEDEWRKDITQFIEESC